jgi:hypothetical protein
MLGVRLEKWILKLTSSSRQISHSEEPSALCHLRILGGRANCDNVCAEESVTGFASSLASLDNELCRIHLRSICMYVKDEA